MSIYGKRSSLSRAVAITGFPAQSFRQRRWLDEEKVRQAFRSGNGLGWHDHGICLFRGTDAGIAYVPLHLNATVCSSAPRADLEKIHERAISHNMVLGHSEEFP
ncbi:hypothetical protein NKJ06_27965 [Mesorhizobium sp. M0293]